MKGNLITRHITFLADQWIRMLEFYCRLMIESSTKDVRVNLSTSNQKNAYLDGYLMATTDILLSVSYSKLDYA